MSGRRYNSPVVRWVNALTPHLPAALLLLWTGSAGAFFTGTYATWAVAGHLGLLIFAAAFGDLWPDPLRLGRKGRWLLLAFAVSVLASHLTSPVTRAGRLAVVLLPAFLMVPSAVARCWPDERAQRLGLRSMSLVATVVAGWSLYGWWGIGTPAASLPLGHPNLLAAWLLVVVPLATLPWRDGGGWKAVAAAAATLGLTAFAATGSLAATLAAGAVTVAVAAWWSRSRPGWTAAVLATGVLLLALQLPRLGAVVRGLDASTSARWSYVQAGWRGVLERPVLGWGPGAARWTFPEHLRPIPGLLPPDQQVADPHSLPLLLAYELGLGGLLLAVGVAAVFLRVRPRQAADPTLRRAALLGLAALLTMGLAGRTLAAPAVPLAVMIAAGAILAAEAPAARRGRRGAASAFAVVIVMAALAAPLDLAHLAYDRAVAAGDRDEQRRHLRRAVALDPAFPLYSARLAWLGGGDGEAARRARAAAESARGVAPLWTVAGTLGQDAGEAWSREALVRACRLSPLGAVAPYRLSFEEASGDDLRVQWTARALLAEPLLSAAVAWRDRGSVLGAAVDRLARVDGVDPGWHAWLARALAERRGGEEGATRQLALAMDAAVETSVSVYAFRRRPWPIDLARIEISASVLDHVAPGTRALVSGDVVRHPLCGLGPPSPL